MSKLILLPQFVVSDKVIETAIKDYLQENGDSEESRAGLFSTPLPPVSYKGRVFKAAQIRYTKNIKRITLMRFLCGKLIFEPDRIERIDILLIYDNILQLQDIAVKDANFRLKFGSDLESLAKLLKGFNLSPKSNKLQVHNLGSQIKKDIPNFPYPARNLKSVWKHVQTMYYVTEYIEQGKLRKLIPPKGYIGKGYTDKGTAKDPAFDGSPSWQSVATSLDYEETLI